MLVLAKTTIKELVKHLDITDIDTDIQYKVAPNFVKNRIGCTIKSSEEQFQL